MYITFEEIMDYKRQINKLKAELDDLKGENIDLINHADFIEQGKIKKVIDSFKAEIRELKADIKHDAKVCDDYDDGLLAEIEELNNHLSRAKSMRDEFGNERDNLRKENDKLQADNKRLYQEHKECRDALEEQVSDLMIDKDRLIDQVGSDSHNNSSTHTHTQKEIEEYMDHNQSNKAYIFVVDADAVNGDGFIADSHAVSTIHDTNCVAIHSM